MQTNYLTGLLNMWYCWYHILWEYLLSKSEYKLKQAFSSPDPLSECKRLHWNKCSFLFTYYVKYSVPRFNGPIQPRNSMLGLSRMVAIELFVVSSLSNVLFTVQFIKV